MTPLRQRYLDDLRLRNYAPRTIRTYVARVACFARCTSDAPRAHLGPDDVRALPARTAASPRSPGASSGRPSARLRLLYGVTLRRPEQLHPLRQRPRALPTVLAPQEVVRLIDAARPGRDRLLLQVAYACGLRISELVHLRVTDVDLAALGGRRASGAREAKRIASFPSPLAAAQRTPRSTWRQHPSRAAGCSRAPIRGGRWAPAMCSVCVNVWSDASG